MRVGLHLSVRVCARAQVTAGRVASLPGTQPVMGSSSGDAAEQALQQLPPVRAASVSFAQGDACALDVTFDGTFDAVLASNLLCRLPRPADFLRRVPALLRPGGIFVLASPYSWLEEYTPKSEWLGGYRDSDQVAVDSAAAVVALLEGSGMELAERFEAPFVIREHARKFQWGTSDTTVWRLKA